MWVNIKTAQQLPLGFSHLDFEQHLRNWRATDVKMSVQALLWISLEEHQNCLEVLTNGFQDQIKTHLTSRQVNGRQTFATPHTRFFSVPCTERLISYRNSIKRSLQTILALFRGFCTHRSNSDVSRYRVTKTGPFG